MSKAGNGRIYLAFILIHFFYYVSYYLNYLMCSINQFIYNHQYKYVVYKVCDVIDLLLLFLHAGYMPTTHHVHDIKIIAYLLGKMMSLY